eukprot:g26525.t1
MNRWRTITLLLLLVAPVLMFVVVGGYTLWQSGHIFWLWFSLPAGWGIAYLLARSWNKQLLSLQPDDSQPPMHWTPRDRDAWKLVEERIGTAPTVDPVALTRIQHYMDTARDVAEEIARHYHPKAKDPFGSLTIPEILAAAQLALEDLAEIYAQYVPGGQLVTVNNWRTIARLPKHYKTFSNIATAAYALFSPLTAAGRYVASKTVMAPVTRQIQANLLTWFYTSFLQRVGFYVIEMNSGRLGGGSKKFREAYERLAKSSNKPWEWRQEPDAGDTASDLPPEEPAIDPTSPPSTDEVTPDVPAEEVDDAGISVCLVGQRGAGKSSLVKVFTDRSSVETETLAKTSTVRVHRFQPGSSSDNMALLDTQGYSSGDEDTRIGKDLKRALPLADLVLLVIDVTGSAREADVRFLRELVEWYEQHPHLKPPPVIAVLTHIDLLRPVMEWDPPYDWEKPTRPKEQTIHDAVAHNREELGAGAIDVVPVCSDVDHDRVFGFREKLLPAMSASINEARACGMLRDLHSDLGQGKVHKVLEQTYPMKVLIADKLSSATITELNDLGADVDFQPDLTADDLPTTIGDTNVLVVRSTKVTAATIDAAKNLSLIIRAGAGVNTIDVATASSRGIYVANCPGKNSAAVAELAIGLLIACDRQIVNASADLRNGHWRKKQYGNAGGLNGRVLGIIGLGTIGLEVVARARGLGMQVVAWSRSLTPKAADKMGIWFAETPLDVASTADAVSIHAAYTPETHHIVNAEFLDTMKEGSILINTSRGDLVDTNALRAAIAEKQLRVGLDVFEDEPAGGDAEFADTDLAALVTATPHIGASTDEAAEAIAAEVVRIVQTMRSTGKPANTVNLCERTPATHSLVVRHYNRVGVLAGVLDLLKADGVNVEEMENTIFDGAAAACCTLHLDTPPSNETVTHLESNADILQVTLEAR